MSAQRALLALAVVAGAAAGAIYWAATQRTGVVVAAADLEPGRPIEARDVETRDLPPDALPDGALTDPAAAVGRYVRGPLARGQLVLSRELADSPATFAGGVPLPPGLRAIAIPVDASGAVGGAVRPGSRVDVLAVPRDARDGGGATELVVPSALVIDVRGEQGGPFAVPNGPRTAAGTVRDRLGSVVIAVGPDAELWIADRISTRTFVLALVPAE